MKTAAKKKHNFMECDFLNDHQKIGEKKRGFPGSRKKKKNNNHRRVKTGTEVIKCVSSERRTLADVQKQWSQ